MSRAMKQDTRLQSLGSPIPVQVQANADGVPQAIRHPDGRRFEKILGVQEIWRIDDEWWRRPLARLYHRAIQENGKQVTFFRDLLDGCWYVH